MNLVTASFRPAQYHKGKCCYIDFYVTDPGTGSLRRQRIKLNRYDQKTRDKYARILCDQLNLKLASGWNPLVEARASNAQSSMAEAMEYYKKHFMPERPDSQRTYTSCLKYFSAWCSLHGLITGPASAFTHHHAVRFLADRSSDAKLSPRSYNNNLTVMHTVFNKLIEHHYAIDNPFKNISKKKARGKNRDVIPDHVMEMIIRDIEKNDPRFMLAMKILYYCGIRPSELCRLQVHNVRTEDRVIFISADQSKNHRDGSVTVPSQLMIDIMHHIGNHKPSAYLFGKNENLKPGDEPLNPRRLSKHWDRMRKRTNLPIQYKYYSLKDTGTTFMAGVLSPIEVKNQMRHHSLSITNIYLEKVKPRTNENILKLQGKL